MLAADASRHPTLQRPTLRHCDEVDCGESKSCCVGEGNYRLISSCRTECDRAFEAPACSSDHDCAEDEHCCSAISSSPDSSLPPPNTIGVCTRHACVEPPHDAQPCQP